MGRNRYVGYLKETARGYLAVFDLHWNVLDARRIEPQLGAALALDAFIAEYAAQGWTAESQPEFGFAFMHRDGIRILIEATPRDPKDKRLQSFTPFGT